MVAWKYPFACSLQWFELVCVCVCWGRSWQPNVFIYRDFHSYWLCTCIKIKLCSLLDSGWICRYLIWNNFQLHKSSVRTRGMCCERSKWKWIWERKRRERQIIDLDSKRWKQFRFPLSLSSGKRNCEKTWNLRQQDSYLISFVIYLVFVYNKCLNMRNFIRLLLRSNFDFITLWQTTLLHFVR